MLGNKMQSYEIKSLNDAKHKLIEFDIKYDAIIRLKSSSSNFVYPKTDIAGIHFYFIDTNGNDLAYFTPIMETLTVFHYPRTGNLTQYQYEYIVGPGLLKKEKDMPEYRFTKEWESGISINDLEDAKACKSELYRFAYHAVKEQHTLFHYKLSIVSILKYAGMCDGGINWLLDGGFIEVIEPKVFYAIGQKFKNTVSKRYHMLVSAGPGRQVVLIDLEDGTRTRIEKLEVSSLQKITIGEFYEITNKTAENFKPVKNFSITEIL